MGRMPTAESTRVQRHLFRCGPWLHRLIEVEVKLDVMDLIQPDRSPVPDKRKPLYITHYTGDGFLYSRAERRGHKWIARHWGEQLDDACECSTMREGECVPDLVIRRIVPRAPLHGSMPT
jgi:hypothetical protein